VAARFHAHFAAFLLDDDGDWGQLALYRKGRQAGLWTWEAGTSAESALSLVDTLAAAACRPIERGALLAALEHHGSIPESVDATAQVLGFPTVSGWMGPAAVVPEAARRQQAASISRRQAITSIFTRSSIFSRCGP
jgi:hypothetical protein